MARTRMKKKTHALRLSRRNGVPTVAAGEVARLDSDVINGGGTDDTIALQTILDQAPAWGGLHLIMDGAALVRGLNVHSNTTIECRNKACGFFLAPGANRAIIRNAHPDFKTRRDRNITLLGGVYNLNSPGQAHHVMCEPDTNGAFGAERWVMGMEFYGVEDLTLRDVTLRNQRTFALLAANWYRVTMENINIELPDNQFGQNQDGLHFWGPGQYLVLRNIKGTSGDDFIALAPDENDKVSDITDVIIDGVFLDDADQGIRMLSRETGRLDRVVVRNVIGTYKSFGFYINPWFPGSGGNYGNITFEHVDLRPTRHKYDYTNPFLFRIGGRIESLTLRDIRHRAGNDARPVAEIGIPFLTPNDERLAETSPIKTLIVDGLQVFERAGDVAPEAYFKVLCPVDSLVIRDAHIHKAPGPAQGCLIQTGPQANIGRLHISGLTANGLAALVDHPAGSIGALAISNVLITHPGAGESASIDLLRGAGQVGQMFTETVFGS